MEFEWYAAELKLTGEIEEANRDIFVELSKEFDQPSEEEIKNQYTWFPSKKRTYIADEKFIDSSASLRDVIEYYSTKELSGDKYLVICGDRSPWQRIILTTSPDESTVYQNLIESEVVDLPQISKATLNISPMLFEEICQKNLQAGYKAINHLLYMRDLLSLISISDQVISKDGNLFRFYFLSEEGKKAFVVKWKDWNALSNGIWFECYKWITDSGTKSIDSKIKREIVRTVLRQIPVDKLSSQSKDKIQDLICGCNSALRMVISNKTKEYFQLVNAMKNEYVNLFSKHRENYNSFVNQFLSLIVAIALGIYTLLDKGLLNDLPSNKGKVVPFLVFFLIAELFVLVSQLFQRSALQDFVDKLKNIYKHRFFMFDEIVDETLLVPKVWLPYVCLGILLGLTVVALVVIARLK